MIHNESYTYAYFFWILSSIKINFGQILVWCMTKISNMFLAQCWRLETASRPFMILWKWQHSRVATLIWNSNSRLFQVIFRKKNQFSRFLNRNSKFHKKNEKWKKKQVEMQPSSQPNRKLLLEKYQGCNRTDILKQMIWLMR